MSTPTKIYGVLGLSLFVLGVSLVSLHLVVHSGEIEPNGLVGVFMQLVGTGFIIGALIRLAGGR